MFAIIAPSDGVDIAWTRIGNARLQEPLMKHYDDAGRLNSVKFDLGTMEISIDAVSGEATTAFPCDIAGATQDGNDCRAFKGNVLKTQEGTHSFSVRLTR